MRLLTAICVLTIAVAFCMPAFAETQNVKVSGDINVWTLIRNRIENTNSLSKSAVQANIQDTTTIFTQQVGVNVAADLTDNVSTYIRVINERDWDDPGNASMDIDLDEAYITLKEFLYAPLTVKLGRQNLWFGKGFIIGNNSASWDANGSLTADQISDMTAFDAIRGTLDYNPWTIDLVMSKIDENTVASTDDVDIYGVNVGYVFDKYEAEAEGYYWAKVDRSDRNTTLMGKNETHAMGLRGSLVPYEHLNLWGEIALQLGQYANNTTREFADREAVGIDVGIDYTFTDIKWTPVLGGEYIFYSGAQAENHTKAGTDWHGWDVLYRGKFDSLIREYLDTLYATAYSGGAATAIGQRIAGNTNQHQAIIRGAITPIEDVMIDSNVNLFWLDENLDVTKNNALTNGKSDTYIGTEWDAKVTYDYTEDVKFQVAGGVFWPGDAYPSTRDETAGQVAARCAVEF